MLCRVIQAEEHIRQVGINGQLVTEGGYESDGGNVSNLIGR